MRTDPMVRAFESECAVYRSLQAELQPLERKLGEGDASEAELQRWRELQASASSEQSRLNALMYGNQANEEQRAAMWWILRGGPASER
jgi:cell shape-determining protein MreC